MCPVYSLAEQVIEQHHTCHVNGREPALVAHQDLQIGGRATLKRIGDEREGYNVQHVNRLHGQPDISKLGWPCGEFPSTALGIRCNGAGLGHTVQYTAGLAEGQSSFEQGVA